MGRIKKTATERHEATISPYITDFIKTLVDLPLHKLPEHIASFPHNWPFPRGDLYHWIAPLNRFDRILERFTTEYALDKGPQTQPFELRLLQKGDAESGSVTDVSVQELQACGYSGEGDRELVESILNFTRILLERCGNRSLYASSALLNHLFNTASLSLLKITLRVTLRLAQRYHTSRMRVASPHSLQTLLQGHYNIALERIQKLANPFPKRPTATPIFGQTPSKNKEKDDAAKPSINTSDIESLVKAKEIPQAYKDELSSVHLTYYDKTDASAPSDEARAPNTPGSPMPPITPTPARRTSNLGPGSARSERTPNNTDAPETPIRPQQSDSPSTGPKVFELSSAQISEAEPWKVMQENIAKVPEDSQYDLLQRVRVASAFQTSRSAVHDLVAVRILAISNLSYVYGETTFYQRIGQADSEEPRRTQLAQQLTDMLQPPSSGQEDISREMTVIVIQALEALAKSKSKTSDVANALNITVSHGVLFYVLRKILATLGDEQASSEDHEWCKDVFDLVMTLTPAAPHPQRNADVLVAAGFVEILVDILNLRTKHAEIYFPIALGFFDNFIHNGVRDAFQAIVNAKGLDVLADLTAFEVQRSLEAAQKQEGLPASYKTKITDYQIPFNSQQTLRQLLKFVAHMYHHNVGTDDRLLRNFVDSPQLLGALRTIFDNASVFGSNVWSGAMNILSSFIHNEPTSYQVIAEAGLSKGFLEAVTQESIPVSDVVVENADNETEETAEMTTQKAPAAESSTEASNTENRPKAAGILPMGETMRDIPTAFGAICLNENGMRMFQASKALEKFLEIFESPEHIKAMEEDAEVPQYIGTAFDELVRHHPQLKERTSKAVVSMVDKVLKICSDRAATKGVGAKLWLPGDKEPQVAGGRNALRGLSVQEVEDAEHDKDDTNFYGRVESKTSNSNDVATESQLESDAVIKGRGGGYSSSDFIAMVCRFLGGFLSNHSMATAFCEAAGAELLLDMATAACNPYNFNETLAQQELGRVLQQLVEHKPHLILPSLARRAQLAVFQVRTLTEHRRGKAYFSDLTDSEATETSGSLNDVNILNATYTAKAMVQAQFLCHVFSQVFAMHVYHGGRTVPHHFFGQVNLTDVYTDLIDDLGQLYSSCVWEAITMRNNMPEEWRKQIHISGMSFDHSEADNVMGLDSGNSQSNTTTTGTSQEAETKKNEARNTAQFKNCQILASLFNQVSTGVLSFFQAVGKSLLWKHSSRSSLSDYQKQNAGKMAEHMADALIEHMATPQPSTTSEVDRVAYDIVVLTSTLQTLVDERKTTRSGGIHREVFTLVLQKFYQKGGFKQFATRLQQFCKLIEQHKEASLDTSSADDVTSSKRVHALALAGIDKILEFYLKISHSKNIHDAQQTTVMVVRDRQKSDFFLGAQFLVEIRNTVLPQVSQMWKSSVMEALPAHSVKSIIDLLKTALEGDGEANAVKRSENLKRRVAAEPRVWKLRTEAKDQLKAEGFESDELCIEALYRCNNNVNAAKEYYALRRDTDKTLPCCPLPNDEEPQPPTRDTQGQSGDSSTQPAASSSVPSVEMQDADEAESSTQETDGDRSDNDLAFGNGNRRLMLPQDMLSGGIAEVLSHALGGGEELMRALPVHRRPSDEAQRPADVVTEENFVTVEDLDEKRKDIRDGLIDRCLDVLNTHTDVTFQLSDLVAAAVAKAGDDQASKVEIGETLVNSLMSLRPEEGTPIEGQKIASYAHLLALVIQERDFFDASLETLKENFEYFGAFIKMFQGQKPDETSPWVSNVLLVIERVLAEDEQPQQIQWTPPPFEDPYKKQDIVELKPPVIPDEDKSTVFDALVEILPKIGKDEVLALSVTRTLVILTRRRALAKKLGEKLSIQRLFVMVKQLAGVGTDRLQNTFLILLRHIIEDDETIRQTMRTEIQATFENKGMVRTLDTTLYTRTLYYLALRSPEIFVEVTNEKVQLSRWDQNRAGGAQPLMLKKEEKPEETKKGDQPKEGESSAAPERPTIERTKTSELKAPSIENPDGVIQFLLKELSSYKDVEDKETQSAKPATSDAPATASSSDVEMSDSTPISIAEPTAGQSADPQPKPADKPVFKVEEHPIFAYRCFLLQCLVELLQSYNRTKIEFINFSRKAEYQASTPSKPRSGLLNYFLTSLIPVGTLAHPDDIASRKRAATANWAINTIVSLCSKTNERVISLKISSGDEESDLAYVRKFVLEHALRAYKDAMSSSEPLDQKYARLLSLSNLFYRMLTGKQHSTGNHFILEMVTISQKQLGRFMYEKNFITALTSSIAELDLNFPGAKRAVKYILRPLKLLTDIGVTLSISGDVSAPGTTEEDEISSATSISDDEQEREETPDLFRNSTLGMFEAANSDDDEDESGSDEAEEYYDGDEYGEEMDYDEYEEGGPGMHEGDVVSDEDDDIDGMGEIEGLPGDIDVEVAMDEDDESGDDEDSDMDEADSDEGDDIEIIDEITGDDENASMEEDDDDEDDDGEEEDWDDDDDDEGDDPYHGAIPIDALGAPHGGTNIFGGNIPALDDDRSDVMDQMDGDEPVMTLDMGGPEQYFEDEMGEDDEDNEEDEDEEVLGYEPEHDDPENDEMDWGWEAAAMPPGVGGWRRTGGPYYAAMDDPPLGLPRSHRGGAAGRGDEDGTNPLLQRSGRNAVPPGPPRPGDMHDWLHHGHQPRIGGHEGLSFVSDLIQMVGPQGARISVVDGSGALGFPHGALATGMPPAVFHIAGGPGQFRFPDLRALSRLTRGLNGREQPLSGRSTSSDPNAAVSFQPAITVARWQDEARLLFNHTYIEKALKVVDSMLRLLVPPAMEAKRQKDKAEAERKVAEEKAREEQRQKEEAERIEREAREQREQEEREAKEAEEAAARARERAERGEPAEGTESMEGVEQPQEAIAAESAPRVVTSIRGRDIDITHLGIDLEYLEALPEDMREEVIMQQFQEQRAQEAAQQPAQGPAAGRPSRNSEINREFLDALPPDIQQELLASEAADRRRRERDEARRRAAASGGPAVPQAGEMDMADFFATLNPALRQQVLMDADDGTLAGFPAEFQAEARALLGNLQRRGGGRERRESERPQEEQETPEVEEQRVRRPVIQMLDKSGVATLLRLMFVAMQDSARTTMQAILSDICKNTQNRAEVISILLSILQDGSSDANALEKSFAQLTLRAKQMSGQKTPQPLKRSLTGSQMTAPNTDVSPLMIVQQCLSTLTHLANENPRVSSFFLSEHETSISQRAKSLKKGKGKESKAAKYPLNALLTLLDRKSIIENSSVMEGLASLLIRVTEPLKILLRKAKDAEKEKEKAAEKAADASNDVPMTEGEASTTAETTEAPAEAAKPQEPVAKTEEKKKHRDLTPPEVPEENLRLVVNIIAARECNAKTFQSTLDIINHLSAIPGAKETFGKELVHRAQELGDAVLVDLQQLAPQIQNAKTSTDIQGIALANFSPASSHQSKLLRVLLALDYLFDPKRSGSHDRSAAEASPSKARQDLLSTLYETSTFAKLWSNLSDCLTAIRQRGNMNNVATILQPLIESFMVVCKNTTSKEANLAASQELPSGTPQPDSRIEKLFFSFTEEHRKILNDLVRNNPKLLNGTFDVLAKNSKVLEFDNKRNYFTRRMHTRSAEDRMAHPSVQLNIRRDQIFMDSFKNLYYKSPNEIKYGKLNIRFHGEEGVDAGGVTREWFAALSRQMFNPDYALFNPVASDRTTFHPNPMSDINPEHLTFFKFVGRIIGKALYEGRVLDCHFSRAVYRRILGKPVSLKDMETLDLDYYRSLCWILENDITDVTFETFSVEVDRFGETEVIDLIENGRNIAVTEENKQEYVRLVVEHRLIKSVEEQLEHFLKGFHEIIPAELIAIFNEQELELLISGLPEIDVDDWKNNSEYHNYQSTSPQVQWFWRAVRSFDKEEKAKLLQFVTGTSKVPLNGFKELEGMNGFTKFNIHRDFGSKDRLPSSHTCFNQLDLPEYETYEQLRAQMYTAMTQGSEYFGFA